MNQPSICARSVWQGDAHECRRLYRQFVENFGGSFTAISAYYQWKRAPMIQALRQGRVP